MEEEKIPHIKEIKEIVNKKRKNMKIEEPERVLPPSEVPITPPKKCNSRKKVVPIKEEPITKETFETVLKEPIKEVVINNDNNEWNELLIQINKKLENLSIKKEQRPKRIVKSKEIKKTLDLSIDDKELDKILDDKVIKTDVKDEKLQTFLNGFLQNKK